MNQPGVCYFCNELCPDHDLRWVQDEEVCEGCAAYIKNNDVILYEEDLLFD